MSTDYLLKDEIEDADVTISEENDFGRRVTLEEANRFIEVKIETSKMVANGVFLCIISPICLLILGALSETKSFGISENVAGAVGFIILMILVAIAVAIFIYSHSKTAQYEYLEKEIFDTEYGVISLVNERKEKFQNKYIKNNIIGVSLCILAMVPFFTGVMFEENNLILMVSLLCLALFIVGIGVVLLVRVGIISGKFCQAVTGRRLYKRKEGKESNHWSHHNSLLVICYSYLSGNYIAYTKLAGRMNRLGHCGGFISGCFWQSQMYLRKTNHENDICSRLRTAS